MKLRIATHDHYVQEMINARGETSLVDYIESARIRYNAHLKQNPNYNIPFKDEDLIYAIQDWYSMMGEFSENELRYLEEDWGLNQIAIKYILEEV